MGEHQVSTEQAAVRQAVFDHIFCVNRHSANRSRTVRTRLAEHEEQIALHFLPSHSPELNPDRLVNADLKRSLPHTLTGPGARPNSPPIPAGSSITDRTSCAENFGQT
ncbi:MULTISPECIES: transposase [unclassified Streptomyces]|uniref:transposase n=1 Tax=unclassified Streptomyces TaxID=2593676 RepID=UPI0035E297F4